MTQPHRAGFTGSDRSFLGEEELHLTSVGVDIGSSTSHLVFSELELERRNTRYVIVKRTILRESDILLTPYVDEGTTIDADGLGQFIDAQYKAANLRREQIDTGALILTGVAVRRHNARAIADLFAQDAGKFVAVSAGDGLEATMAAHGSGAVDESERTHGVVMNIDIGGGTSKVAICRGGRALEVTAVDVGARLLAFDDENRITRIEEAGRFYAKEAGLNVENGMRLSESEKEAIVAKMTDCLMQVVLRQGVTDETRSVLRLPELSYQGKVDSVIFSGGVAEFIYGYERGSFGDLGPLLAKAVRERLRELGAMLMVPAAGIRATVVGASQYTVQVSGSTILIAPIETVPIRNIPVLTPDLDLTLDDLDPDSIAEAVRAGLTRLDLHGANTAVAVGFRWGGSATYQRLDSFTRGIASGLQGLLDNGNPLVLVSNGDIGGLLGLHLREELELPNAVISIDGIELREFDFIDIGELIPSSGAVPVVIKSLVFPGQGGQTE